MAYLLLMIWVIVYFIRCVWRHPQTEIIMACLYTQPQWTPNFGFHTDVWKVEQIRRYELGSGLLLVEGSTLKSVCSVTYCASVGCLYPVWISEYFTAWLPFCADEAEHQAILVARGSSNGSQVEAIIPTKNC